MCSIISGDNGYNFAERWINEEMIDKTSEYFGRAGIDEFFISEICNKDNYSPKKLFKKVKKNSKILEKF